MEEEPSLKIIFFGIRLSGDLHYFNSFIKHVYTHVFEMCEDNKSMEMLHGFWVGNTWVGMSKLVGAGLLSLQHSWEKQTHHIEKSTMYQLYLPISRSWLENEMGYWLAFLTALQFNINLITSFYIFISIMFSYSASAAHFY